MKKLLLACCFVAGMVSLSKAQGGGGRGMMRKPADQAKEMQTQLKLTDDQTAKITAILETQKTRMDSVRTANSGGDRQAMMQASQPIRKASQEKIGAILTADQKSAWKKIEEERMQKMRERMGNGNGGGNDMPPPPPPSPSEK